MKLAISNLAKIAHAELEFHGITIVAGENNTGKSTAGKVLYSVFTALSNLSGRVSGMRIQKLEDIVSRYVSEQALNYPSGFYEEIVEFVAGRRTEADFTSSLRELLLANSVTESDIDSCISGIRSVLGISRKSIENEVIEKEFIDVFNGQYRSVIDVESIPEVHLSVQGKKIDLVFQKDSPAFSSEISLRSKALFLSDPGLVDAIQSGRLYHFAYVWDEVQYGVLRDVWFQTKEAKENPDKGVIDGIINTGLLKTVMDHLSTVVHGSLHFDRRQGYLFSSEKLKADLNPKNLSTGLKAFVLLQFLIQNRVLNPKDVLILDEPEIHLHPEWQLKYAELVVLLQKYFDLTILITSHSPYFIDAIRLYSKKHGISDKVNAYCSVLNADETVTMNVVKPDDWDELFAHFLPPMDELQTMREQYGV